MIPETNSALTQEKDSLEFVLANASKGFASLAEEALKAKQVCEREGKELTIETVLVRIKRVRKANRRLSDLLAQYASIQRAKRSMRQIANASAKRERFNDPS